MLFPAGARSELSSPDGRRRPIAFYDASNGDMAAFFDDQTTVFGDLDELFYKLLIQDTCRIHIPVEFEAASSGKRSNDITKINPQYTLTCRTIHGQLVEDRRFPIDERMG